MKIDNGEQFIPSELDSKINEIILSNETNHQFYILEEKCGKDIIKLLNEGKLTVEKFFEELLILINKYIESEILYIDFKLNNTCTLTDENENLLLIRGLDFDTKYIINFSDILEKNTDININDLVQHTGTYMLTIFFVYLFVWKIKYIENIDNINNIIIILCNYLISIL